MSTRIGTLSEITANLTSPDARTRMAGIVALSKRNDATVKTLMLVGRLLHDKDTVDPNPSTYQYGPALLIPKWTPSVMSCAHFFLPYITKNSPKAILELANSLASMPDEDKKVAFEIFSYINLPALATLLMTLDEEELARTCSALKQQDIKKILFLLNSFSSPLVERPQKVISSLTWDDSKATLASLPEDLARAGIVAIPYLAELVKYNAEHPQKSGFLGTVKYLTALKSIAALQRMGVQAKGALEEIEKSPIEKISTASKKALLNM